MNNTMININGINIKIITHDAIVIGTGAAGLCTAERLHSMGITDVAIVTEGINKGTSRNTGSDKQTYYKLTLSGDGNDSVIDMAKTLFEGGAMDGEHALAEAALSARSFFHLVELGVPFPHTGMGQYAGYKTDHDPRYRATSAGPLTSKYMTECLHKEVLAKNIKIYDNYQVIKLLKKEDTCIGLVVLDLDNLDDENERYKVFNAGSIVMATGGPAGLYADSVYPVSQSGSTGIALEAGVMGKNLTEWQYGLASIKFRWNLSGTYQQVIPRYVSTDKDGNNPKEFLNDWFSSNEKLSNAIFLKGYQWPFDPRKIDNEGSSLIDVLVFNETKIKGRRVFLDFLNNPSFMDIDGTVNFDALKNGSVGYKYLMESKALFGKPIDRLKHMNNPAIELYKNNGIDLENEMLEIAVCAQHNNGGLYVDGSWETNINNLFVVGEAAASHGVYRPGGSALNAGQVGSLRASETISKRKVKPNYNNSFIDTVFEQLNNITTIGKSYTDNIVLNKGNTGRILRNLRNRMSTTGAHIRELKEIDNAINKTSNELSELSKNTVLNSIDALPYAFRNRDLLMTQFVYLSAMKDYIENGGKSRGSYLINDNNGKLPIDDLPDIFRYSLDDGSRMNKVQQVKYGYNKCEFIWRSRNPIPDEDLWFENVWNSYMKGKDNEKESIIHT